MFMFTFLHVMWRTQKHPIGAKVSDLILSLKFHLLKGVRGALWLGEDSCFKNFF